MHITQLDLVNNGVTWRTFNLCSVDFPWERSDREEQCHGLSFLPLLFCLASEDELLPAFFIFYFIFYYKFNSLPADRAGVVHHNLRAFEDEIWSDNNCIFACDSSGDHFLRETAIHSYRNSHLAATRLDSKDNLLKISVCSGQWSWEGLTLISTFPAFVEDRPVVSAINAIWKIQILFAAPALLALAQTRSLQPYQRRANLTSVPLPNPQIRSPASEDTPPLPLSTPVSSPKPHA
jgi:hypothetical protein